MKMKPLSAVVAATLGAGLMSSAAYAVYVNPDGLGQALIYPYYTAESGYTTNFQVVNTSDVGKVVKVRFLEAMNSQEVLDFNLYLSAHDEWTGVIVPTAAGGAAVMSNDKSCTVPAVAGTIPFRSVQYAGDSVNGIGRTLEGYIELIGMGNIDPASDLGVAITHGAGGVPADCSYVITHSASNTDPTIPAQVLPPTGGLYGYATLVNVGRGTAATYDATALAAFTAGPIYNGPGSILPNLASADPSAIVFDGSTAAVYNLIFGGATPGADAVSATMMAADLDNDYVVDSFINAGTDWVVTFPTKRFYVNQNPALPPFTASWDPTVSQACEPVTATKYDREEQSPGAVLDFSPQTIVGTALCYEANVITFQDQNGNDSDVLNSQYTKYSVPWNDGFDAGWMNLDLTGLGHSITTGTLIGPGTPMVLNGLPAIGFADIQFTNGDVGGLLANYAGITAHKLVRSITSAL